ncbi:hypothetical protein R3P38DRAFT_2565269 [Favolaschia claudopus]|uniref:C2H2-type domain-containing protein n=1 Tax=Favolaschia claudopus TaxID=2862362 RepID=A0AAW0A1C1_9AGAR
MVSSFLRRLIRDHEPHCYKTAYGYIARGWCQSVPPPPVIDAGGNYSHRAYATFLFGGGPCTWCSKHTDEVPCSWLFCFRACSTACNKQLFSEANMFSDKNKQYDGHPFGKWLPRITQSLVPGESIFTYSSRAIKRANREQQQSYRVAGGRTVLKDLEFPRRNVEQLNEEYSKRARARPVLLQHGLEVERWQKPYLQERNAIAEVNSKYIKLLCQVEHKKLQGIMRCPTMAKLFNAFNRDLELITFTVWAQNRNIILTELKVMTHGILPAGTLARHNDKIRCSYCARLIAVQGMADHVVDKHRNESADDIPFIPAREEKHCPLCPESKRVYSKRGLKDHRLGKYVAFNDLLF